MRHPTLILAALLSAGCSGLRPADLTLKAAPDRSGCCLTIRVLQPDAQTPQPNAPVYLQAGAPQLVARTDTNGEVVLSKRELGSPRPASLLFCWDELTLSCTALRLDVTGLATFDGLNVTLPLNPINRPGRLLRRELTLEPGR